MPETVYTIDENPPQRLDMVLGDCLGPVALLARRLEDICPTLLEDRTCESESSDDCLAVEAGQCDPAFLEPIQQAADDLEQIVQDNADVSLFDLLSGHGSIPVTAMVVYGIGVYGEDIPSHTGHIAIVFGDYRDEVEAYRQSIDSVIPSFWNFPLDYIRCTFYQSQDSYGDPRGYVRVVWVPSSLGCTNEDLSLTGINIFYGHNIISLGNVVLYQVIARDGSFRGCDVTSFERNLFLDSTHNIAVTNYALQDFIEDGLDRTEELTDGNPDERFFSRTLFWDIDWSL